MKHNREEPSARRIQLLLVFAVLLTVALVMAGQFGGTSVSAVPSAAAAPLLSVNGSSGQACIRDAIDQATGTICNAKDTPSGGFELVGDPQSCVEGELIEVTLRARIDAGSATRYDVGIWVDQFFQGFDIAPMNGFEFVDALLDLPGGGVALHVPESTHTGLVMLIPTFSHVADQ